MVGVPVGFLLKPLLFVRHPQKHFLFFLGRGPEGLVFFWGGEGSIGKVVNFIWACLAFEGA